MSECRRSNKSRRYDWRSDGQVAERIRHCGVAGEGGSGVRGCNVYVRGKWALTSYVLCELCVVVAGFSLAK